MSHESLISYYKDNLNTVFYKDAGFVNNFTVSELDSLLPWERDVYIMLMRDKLEQQAKQSS
jgi:hypothetical protein